MTTTQSDLESSYQFCQQLAQSHYENFPVASILLPKRLRRPISVIYAFARTADDFADEGNQDQKTRLRQLDDYSAALKQIREKHYQDNNPIFIALKDVIQQHKLPIQLFDDLLSAFKQDVVKSNYATFDEVLDYCKRSANPVGRLLLHLEGNPSDKQLLQSDAICTALQLINFYQDIVQDLTEQNRTYLPTDELNKFGVSKQDLLQTNTDKISSLIRFQYQRAQSIMEAGILLGTTIQGRLGWEIRAMTLGGITILNKLMSQNDHSLLNRPRLNKLTMLRILLSSAFKTIYVSSSEQLLEPSKKS